MIQLGTYARRPVLVAETLLDELKALTVGVALHPEKGTFAPMPHVYLPNGYLLVAVRPVAEGKVLMQYRADEMQLVGDDDTGKPISIRW